MTEEDRGAAFYDYEQRKQTARNIEARRARWNSYTPEEQENIREGESRRGKLGLAFFLAGALFVYVFIVGERSDQTTDNHAQPSDNHAQPSDNHAQPSDAQFIENFKASSGYKGVKQFSSEEYREVMSSRNDGGYFSHTGRRYQGDLRNGLPHGNGVMTFLGDNYYVGKFSDGEPHGQGEMFFRDGSTYKGNFVGGDFQGEGTRTSPDGSQYIGLWFNDQPHGVGTFNSVANGNTYSGRWQNGCFENKVAINATAEECGIN